MNDQMRKILESKRAARRRLAALPFAEKLKLLEQLRACALAIAASPLKQQMQLKSRIAPKREDKIASLKQAVGICDV